MVLPGNHVVVVVELNVIRRPAEFPVWIGNQVFELNSEGVFSESIQVL